MENCVFCKIVKKEIPGDIVYEDDKIIAFKDLAPQAPVHVLIVTKEHIESIDDLEDRHKETLGHLLLKIKDIAADLGLSKGYRIVNNCGEDGLQTVQHIHFHLLGKRKMLWPPG